MKRGVWAARGMAISAACAAGLMAFAGLLALSRADRQGARVTEVRAVAAGITRPAAGGAPASSPCRAGLAEAARDTTAALRGAATLSGVSLQALDFTQLEAQPTDLRGLRFAMTLRGSEADVASFVRSAAAQQLPLFLETVDLRRSAAGIVDADFSGRLLCRRGFG